MESSEAATTTTTAPATANPVEANRIIKEFEKRAKEAEQKSAGIGSKTTRLIEKFEKKSQGIDDRKGGNGGQLINNIKKLFEGDLGLEAENDSPSNVIPSGSTNKLIGQFQQ